MICTYFEQVTGAGKTCTWPASKPFWQVRTVKQTTHMLVQSTKAATKNEHKSTCTRDGASTRCGIGRRPALTDASSLICVYLSSLRGLRRLAVVSMTSLQAPSDDRVISATLRIRQWLNGIRNGNTPTPRVQEFFLRTFK